MYRTYEMEMHGRKFSVEIGRVAELANGAAIVRFGDTAVLVAVAASEKPRQGIDFFPLSIDFEEKLYSVGKIPGGFIKREGRPTEKAILASRLIDRPLRPLFPKDYRNDVSIVATVLSVDQDCSPEIAAMIGSSIVLSISDIPFGGPTGSVNVGYIDGEYVFNPNAEQRNKTKLNLTVASTRHKVMMIEAGAEELDDEIVYGAIMRAHEENVKIVEFIDSIVEKEGAKPKHSYEQHKVPEDLYNEITSFITGERMEKAVFTDMKQEREKAVGEITEEVMAKFLTGDDDKDAKASLINDAIYNFEKQTVRKMILKDHKRPDGRALDEIRTLEADIDIVPRTHGSALFRRGQTQVMTLTTLGSLRDSQRLDGLDDEEVSKRYMHHYNFPSYSVGETRPSRGPGRREIGHGALAERALLPVIPSEVEFPYAIRLVSEVVSSNGSTSQGSVCGSSLSLMAAGVPIKSAVAGISVGLVTDKESGDFVLMTDIQGLEDFFGDMDFKVAGTHEGITAIQMDIKIDGLTPEIIKKSLEQTKKGRMYILDEIMAKCIDKPREEISKYAPKIRVLTIDIEKIAEVIGARGKTIKRIVEETGAQIDIEDDGRVYVCGVDMDKIQKAVDIITAIVTDPEPGQEFTGKVTRMLTFGAFVEFAPEKEGLVHISKVANKRIDKIESVLAIGDIVNVKCAEIDDQGRFNFTMKDVPQSAEITEKINNAPTGTPGGGGGERRDRGDRGGRDDRGGRGGNGRGNRW